MRQVFTRIEKEKSEEIDVGETFKHGAETYIRVMPVRSLHNSNLIREVVYRGDYFAVNLSNGTLTILPSKIKYRKVDASFKVEGE